MGAPKGNKIYESHPARATSFPVILPNRSQPDKAGSLPGRRFHD
jgi:hypothetical protein